MIEVIGQLLLVLLALAAVIGMIFGAAWLARCYGGVGLLGSSTRMRTLAVTNVGQRERVVLLEVHGVQLLLGVAAGSVRTLHEFPPGSFPVDPVTPVDGTAPATGGPMPFKDALAIAMKRALGQERP